MIGKHVLEINMSDLAIRGMSSTDNITDGAFSPLTDAVNLIASPGALYAPTLPVDSDPDTRLTGNIIATSPDDDHLSSYSVKIVTDDAKYYRYDGTKITEVALRTDGTNTYNSSLCDMITFGSSGQAVNTFVATAANVVRWYEGGGVFTVNFIGFTNTTYPHSAIVYENNAYYSDKNLLLQQAASNSATTSTVLTLGTDQVIMALGIDPGTGLMLISTTNHLQVSDTQRNINKLLWYDGNSLKVVKSVIVEDMITSFQSVGGTVFVGYGTSLGYINGSGISFLRKLNNVSLNFAQLPYKQRLTTINKTLYVVDGNQVLAYGEVINGRKVFYYAFKNNISPNNVITAIFNAGNGKLGVVFSTSKFYIFDVSSVASTNSMAFYTNQYSFPRPVFLRSAYIEYADAVPNNDNNRNLYLIDDTQTTTILVKQGNDTSTALKNTTGANVYNQDNIIGFREKGKTRTVQFRYNTNGTNIGVIRILLMYEPAE